MTKLKPFKAWLLMADYDELHCESTLHVSRGSAEADRLELEPSDPDTKWRIVRVLVTPQPVVRRRRAAG